MQHSSRTLTLAKGWHGLLAVLALVVTTGSAPALATEPDPSTYWFVDDIQPGMKGVGHTVMIGTQLEEFEVEVLGVLRDVSPGRDMVLCRLSGCQLEHSGIIQGMSGSPIYIDGKLLGAVAYAWEFAKDPIAGVTPFAQMVQYSRSSDRRIAAESRDREAGDGSITVSAASLRIEGRADEPNEAAPRLGPMPVAAAGLADMKPIAVPLAASGFGPRALALLSEQLEPLGLVPMAGGAASKHIVEQEGDTPLEPGSPLSIALVTGDFDLSGIGTVTHVEGDRVYGFGHPMFSLGSCELPMMSGYIHTVYPRASVSMKMGSPLKVVGVIDTDVSTVVAGRLGGTPDMLPMSVRVKAGEYSEPTTYHVQLVREPTLLPSLVMSVLTNAIDTEGRLPDELTARISATFTLEGYDPIKLVDTLSGPRYTGPLGPSALFSPVATITNLLARNAFRPVRIEAIDCEVEIEAGRTVATLESVRLASHRLEPGQTLRAFATLKPFKGDRTIVPIELTLPDDLPEGSYEAVLCDLTNSLRRQFRNQPQLLEPRNLDGVLHAIRLQVEPQRTALILHVPRPERGLAVEGQALPHLPGSARAVFDSQRRTRGTMIRTDLIQTAETPWVIEGSQSVRFTVVKDARLSRHTEP